MPFHYAGVAKEFPTAPTDSFLVANAGYVARATGSGAIGSFLVQTDGTSPGTVAARVRSVVGTTAQVTDIQHQRKIVGSNLTAVELSGLTKVELGFALALAVAASGVALGAGFQERRRTFALASALGARARQLGGFVWDESVLVTAGGLALGPAAAAGVTVMLVKVLTRGYSTRRPTPLRFHGGISAPSSSSRSGPWPPRARRRCARCAGPRSRS